jgi:hypothetical protein
MNLSGFCLLSHEFSLLFNSIYELTRLPVNVLAQAKLSKSRYVWLRLKVALQLKPTETLRAWHPATANFRCFPMEAGLQLIDLCQRRQESTPSLYSPQRT